MESDPDPDTTQHKFKNILVRSCFHYDPLTKGGKSWSLIDFTLAES